jgi:hypothetical protein
MSLTVRNYRIMSRYNGIIQSGERLDGIRS